MDAVATVDVWITTGAFAIEVPLSRAGVGVRRRSYAFSFTNPAARCCMVFLRGEGELKMIELTIHMLVVAVIAVAHLIYLNVKKS